MGTAPRAAGGRAREIKEGVQLAAQSIDSGAALDKLRALVDLSRELGAPKA